MGKFMARTAFVCELYHAKSQQLALVVLTSGCIKFCWWAAISCVLCRPIKSRKDVGANERKRSTKGRIPEEEPSASEADSEAASSSGDGESEFEDEEERKAAERWARVRGLAGPDTSSDSGSSSDDDEDGSEEEGEQVSHHDPTTIIRCNMTDILTASRHEWGWNCGGPVHGPRESDIVYFMWTHCCAVERSPVAIVIALA